MSLKDITFNLFNKSFLVNFQFTLLCLVEYDEAVMYAKNRRIGDTAIYNEKRLFETPIPEINVQNQIQLDASQEASTDENSFDATNADVSAGVCASFDMVSSTFASTSTLTGGQTRENSSSSSDTVLNQKKSIAEASAQDASISELTSGLATGQTNENFSVSVECVSAQPNLTADVNLQDAPTTTLTAGESNDNSSASVEIASTQPNFTGEESAQDASPLADQTIQHIEDVHDLKPQLEPEVVLIVGPTTTTINALHSVIKEPEFIKYDFDEMEIKVDSKIGFCKPFNATSEGLVKRENDIVSGNLPYNETVSKNLLVKCTIFRKGFT